MAEFIDIVLTEPPGPHSEFVEVEDDNGNSVKIGQWITDESGMTRLRIGWTEIGDLND
jgi:hypothetical protein